jgi:hypothetical protein
VDPQRLFLGLLLFLAASVVCGAAGSQWGDRHLSEKPPHVARRRSDRSLINAVLVARDGEPVRAADVEVVPGPG